MNKPRKLQLAEYISSHVGRLSAKGMMVFSDSENLGVQVNTLNSNGDFVIKFSSSDPWMDPVEWLHNYKTSCQRRYEEAKAVYESLFPPDNTCNPLSEDKVAYKAMCFDSIMSMLNTEPIDGTDGCRYRYPAREEFFSPIDDKVTAKWSKTSGNTRKVLHLGLLLEPLIVFDEPYNTNVLH